MDCGTTNDEANLGKLKPLRFYHMGTTKIPDRHLALRNHDLRDVLGRVMVTAASEHVHHITRSVGGRHSISCRPPPQVLTRCCASVISSAADGSKAHIRCPNIVGSLLKLHNNNHVGCTDIQWIGYPCKAALCPKFCSLHFSPPLLTDDRKICKFVVCPRHFLLHNIRQSSDIQ